MVYDSWGGIGRVHRMTLSLNRNGCATSIYCVSCGPLVELQDKPLDESLSQSVSISAAEKQYTTVRIQNLLRKITRAVIME